MEQTVNYEKKAHIAIWTPLPPQKTGIADYVAEILPFLTRFFDIELFVADNYDVLPDFREKYKVFFYTEYKVRDSLKPFDLNIYQMGNNSYHNYIYEQALKVPGLVVLHDLSLSFLQYDYYVGMHHDLEFFKSEMEYSEGHDALVKFSRIFDSGNNDHMMEFFGDALMLRRLVERNYAVMSHLEYCASIARTRYKARLAYSMYLGSPDPFVEFPGLTKEKAREELKIPDNVFLAGVFGHLQATKQNDVVLRALARLKHTHPQLFVAMVGEINPANQYDQFLNEQIQTLQVQDKLRITGYVSMVDMHKYYIACDVIVNLRYPSFGQMSATLSRGVASGLPAIITDLPEWRFLPDNFCWSVSGEDKKGDQLAAYLKQLMDDPSLLQQRAQAAREYYLNNGTSEIAAKKLNDIILDVIENRSEDLGVTSESPAQSISISEQAQRAFSRWDSVRAGSSGLRVSKLRNIPVLGKPLYFFYRLLENWRNMPAQRHEEWSWNSVVKESLVTHDHKTERLVETTNRLHFDLQQLFEEMSSVQSKLAKQEKLNEEQASVNMKIESIIKDVHSIQLDNALAQIAQLSDQVRELQKANHQLTQELRQPYIAPSIKVLENPLSLIPDYQISDLSFNGDLTEENDEFYAELQAAFRGSEALILARGRSVLDAFRSKIASSPLPIVDVGSGRGEFVQILSEHGLNAIGIDTRKTAVSALQEKGFDAHCGDAFVYLNSLPDNSLNGITAFHFVEHLSHAQLLEFLALAYRKIAPQGFLYLETPNPFCPDTLGRFYTDPTHQRPLQPFQLAFLLELSQFKHTTVYFLEPVPARGNLSAERWLTLYQDFGIFATKDEKPHE